MQRRMRSLYLVSVPTRAMLEQLVKDFDGKQMRDGRLVVKDTSMPVEDAQALGH